MSSISFALVIEINLKLQDRKVCGVSHHYFGGELNSILNLHAIRALISFDLSPRALIQCCVTS